MFDFLKKEKEVKEVSFSDKLNSVKQVFKEAYEGAIQLNESITLDNKNKQNEINAIQAQIDFNNKVLEGTIKLLKAHSSPSFQYQGLT